MPGENENISLNQSNLYNGSKLKKRCAKDCFRHALIYDVDDAASFLKTSWKDKFKVRNINLYTIFGFFC